jgi:putative ABC transport system substrate-binding protein
MKRREFIAGLGSVAARPLVARAQQPALPVIGFVAVGSSERFADRMAAFRDGLRRAGFVEGRNVGIESRWAEPGNFAGAGPLAVELVERRVDVIVAPNVPFIAKSVPTAIPKVSLFPGDPVSAGYVASLNQPGGSFTGVAIHAFSLGPKRFELLRDAVPDAKRTGILVNPAQPDSESQADAKGVEGAARAVGQPISIHYASRESDFGSEFAIMTREGVDALLVMADPFFYSQQNQLIALAARYRLPAIYEWREMALAGGMMSYGSSIIDAYRQLGDYAGQILKGAKPAELPVVQTVKIELVLNLKTAKSLGVVFPISLLGRADEVIE